jgi:hypothetical protein
MQTFSKPQAARQLEARARAKRLGVRVAVVVAARSYLSTSQSQPGVAYRIERCRHGWSCECDGFLFTGVCKHLAGVERRAEREGWDFGQVAPLAKVIAPDSMLESAPATATILPFRPRFIEHQQPAAAIAANDELFG